MSSDAGGRSWLGRGLRVGLAAAVVGGAVVYASLSEEEQQGLARQLFRRLSRDTGLLMGLQIPSAGLRELVYGGFAVVNDANIHEAQLPVGEYPSFGDFFARWLRPGARHIDSAAPLVSPVDGRMLIHGRVGADGVLEQIKGQSFRLDEFLRLPPHLQQATDGLYYCVIYLSPRDYHRIHSPVDWLVRERLHYPGTLLSVSPAVVASVPRVFVRNERVVLSGAWQHGFFSLTAVGATNVGSISIVPEPALRTNVADHDQDPAVDASPSAANYQPGFASSRGDEIATFHLGSTVVLVFTSPRHFAFAHQPHQRIQLGEPLGHFVD